MSPPEEVTPIEECSKQIQEHVDTARLDLNYVSKSVVWIFTIRHGTGTEEHATVKEVVEAHLLLHAFRKATVDTGCGRCVIGETRPKEGHHA